MTVPRKTNPLNLRLLTKVSKLYYEQALTQQEIAQRLHLSRPKVSRLLQQAHQRGIVQITVHSPSAVHTDLEQQLEQQFGLKEASIVQVNQDASSEVITRELGTAAARYVQRTLVAQDVLGVSWATTLNAMVNALLPMDVADAHIVQLIGGLGPPEADVHATDICRRCAHLLNCRLTLVPAPGIVNSLEIKQALLSDSHIQHAFSLFPDLTMALVGIGVSSPSSVLMRDGSIITQAELDELKKLGAVGDISLRFFDKEGRPIRASLDERVIGITLEQLQQVERVIGVAGGREKLEAVCGALRGRLINVLITDPILTQDLLTHCSTGT